MHSHMHTSMVHNSGNVGATSCLLTDELVSKMWYIRMRKYYSVLEVSDIVYSNGLQLVDCDPFRGVLTTLSQGVPHQILTTQFITVAKLQI